MKLLLLFFICILSLSSSAQTISDPGKKLNYQTRMVKFKNDGVVLEGLVLLPKHPVAAVVLVHGSGLESRMSSFASQLAKEGIAVLTYDKRGVGKSGGKYAGPEVGTNNIDSSNLNQLASDASVAIDVLKKHLKSKRIPLGLMGFSQAAWVIPLAAKSNQKVGFITLVGRW